MTRPTTAIARLALVASLAALCATTLSARAGGAAPAEDMPQCATPATSPTTTTMAPTRQATPPSPDIAPIRRLGRWNGTTFASLTKPGTITRGHLYVLVHGWQAGMLDAVDSYAGPGPLLIWDPQAVTAQGTEDVDSWLAPLAKALSTLDPKAVVLAYSWLDDAATGTALTDARYSESETVPNGKRLAGALNQAIAGSFTANGGAVHILGHSHGAKVATIAALRLRHRPRQLTLMDSPDIPLVATVGAANYLGPYLRKLSIGRRTDQTFVDSYISIFGCGYGQEPDLSQIVDVQLVPSQYAATDVTDKHLYPPRWYAAAAADPAAGVGPEWSPLLGTRYQKVGLAYVQTHPGDVAEQLALTELLDRAGRAPGATAAEH
jgi:hypothetical protein